MQEDLDRLLKEQKTKGAETKKGALRPFVAVAGSLLWTQYYIRRRVEL
jgi:hypothetical protein